VTGSIIGPQRLDDAGQVGLDRAFRVLRPPAGDGVGDGQVLAERCLGTARPQREPELVPDELGVQPLEQPHRDGLPGDHPDPAVQLPVELGVLSGVRLGDRARELLRELTQLGGLVIGDPLRRLRGAERLQGHPALADSDGLFGGDDPDARAPVGDAFHQPLGGEVEQRGPQRLPGHLEHPREFLFHQPLPGREVPAEDGLPEGGQRVRARGLARLRRSRCPGRHAPTLRIPAPDCQQSPSWHGPQLTGGGPRAGFPCFVDRYGRLVRAGGYGKPKRGQSP
jgi:hypothetical protein